MEYLIMWKDDHERGIVKGSKEGFSLGKTNINIGK